MTDRVVHLLRDITEGRSTVACGAPASAEGRPWTCWAAEVTCQACRDAPPWQPPPKRTFRPPHGPKRPREVVEPPVEHDEDTADVDELPEPAVPLDPVPPRVWEQTWLEDVPVMRPQPFGFVTIAGWDRCEHCGGSDGDPADVEPGCDCLCHAVRRAMRPVWAKHSNR